jgi:choline dehydrogenase
MGSASLGVADEQLRLKGVENLRIVDAGVIPIIPNGNTHSTVCVLASRAVELILASRQQENAKET